MERIWKFARRPSAIRGFPAVNSPIERVKLCSNARDMVAGLNRKLLESRSMRLPTDEFNFNIVHLFDQYFSTTKSRGIILIFSSPSALL